MLYSDCGVFACRGSLAEELHYHVTPVFLISKIEGFTEVLVICSLNYTIYGLDLQGPGYRDAKKPEPLHPCNIDKHLYFMPVQTSLAVPGRRRRLRRQEYGAGELSGRA